MEIRKFNISDYDVVYNLWKRCNMSLSKSDEKEEIHKFLKYNPETSLVGILNNKIIACVLGGYDGRRGLVHHLAVHPDYQKKGYGKEILKHLEDKFNELGVVKMSFWILKDNINVVDFYERFDYEVREDLITMSKVL